MASDDSEKAGDEVPAGTPQSREAICRMCKGTGRLQDKPCADCGGSGKVVVLVGDLMRPVLTRAEAGRA